MQRGSRISDIRICFDIRHSCFVIRRRAATSSQSHQLANVFDWRTAVRNHLVVVLLQVEILAPLLFGDLAKIKMLTNADEIGGKLGGSKPGAFPLQSRLALL